MSDRVLLLRGELRPAAGERLRALAARVDAALVSERRAGVERRAAAGLDAPPRRERRVAERRAAVRPLPLTARLPLRLLAQRKGLVLIERRPLPSETLDDHEALRLLVRHADGDPAAARALFERWFDRAYAYLSGWLEDTRGAQVAAQAAFLALLRHAATVDVARTRFRVLLVEELHAASGLDPAIAAGPAPGARGAGGPRPGARGDDGALDRLGRLNQLDLYILLARLTADERRILMLRHVLKLEAPDAARALGLGAGALDHAERAALGRLLLEVERLGHGDSREGERVPMRAVGRPSPVVCSRRAALALRG